METRYTKKLQIFLTPEQYHRLRIISEMRGEPLEKVTRELLDEAIGEKLMIKERHKAVEALSKMNLPVSDWEQMEREIETMWEEPL